MEVDLPIRKAISPSFLKIASIAAMLLLVLGVSVFNIVSGVNTAVAAVVMDINNSKELLVNSDAKVLKVIDLNQGTQISPSELELQGKDIYTSVALMVDQANTQGGFKQGKKPVMASIIPLNNRQADIVDQAKLRDSIRRLMIEKNISSDLMVSTTDETTQKTAQNLGMSVNNYLVYKGLMAKGFVVNPKGSGNNNTLHMLTEANTTLNSLFPKECVTINPQSETPQETPNAMETPMTGQNMPSNGTQKASLNPSPTPSSGQSQSSSPSTSHNPSSPNMTNTSPPTGYPMPSSSPKNITPSFPIPKQDNMPASSGSESHNMMP